MPDEPADVRKGAVRRYCDKKLMGTCGKTVGEAVHAVFFGARVFTGLIMGQVNLDVLQT